MEEDSYRDVEIQRHETEVTYTRGSGPGGQHKNKVETCVILIHKVTNIKVKIDGRSRDKNEKKAWKILTERVNEFYRNGYITEMSEIRKEQIGSGLRGDKRRTYREKDGRVTDHVTGKRASFKEVLRGNLEKLH